MASIDLHWFSVRRSKWRPVVFDYLFSKYLLSCSAEVQVWNDIWVSKSVCAFIDVKVVFITLPAVILNLKMHLFEICRVLIWIFYLYLYIPLTL